MFFHQLYCHCPISKPHFEYVRLKVRVIIQLNLIFSNTKKTRVQVDIFQIIFNNGEVWRGELETSGKCSSKDVSLQTPLAQLITDIYFPKSSYF